MSTPPLKTLISKLNPPWRAALIHRCELDPSAHAWALSDAGRQGEHHDL